MLFKKKREKPKEEKTEKTEKSTLIILDTNIPMDCAKFQNLEFLDGLEAKAEVFVPWAVSRELISAARMAEEDKKVMGGEDFKKYMEWRDSFLKELKEQKVKDEKAEQMVEAREARIEYAEPACSFVQEKINSRKWGTIGTPNLLKPYLEGFSDELKESLSRADLEILACCFVAAEEYKEKKIILMSLDRGLRNAAEKFGIQTHRGSRDRLFKK